MVDAGHHIYVWAGKDAPPMLKASAIPHAEQYLRRHNRPHVLPITLVKQGMEPEELLACFGVKATKRIELMERDASDANANNAMAANAEAPTLFGDGMMWFVPHHAAVWRKGHPVHSYVTSNQRSFDNP